MSSVSLTSGKKLKMRKFRIFQGSAHKLLNQPLQACSYFLRKEICVNPHRKSNTEGLEGAGTGHRDITVFSMD